MRQGAVDGNDREQGRPPTLIGSVPSPQRFGSFKAPSDVPSGIGRAASWKVIELLERRNSSIQLPVPVREYSRDDSLQLPRPARQFSGQTRDLEAATALTTDFVYADIVNAGGPTEPARPPRPAFFRGDNGTKSDVDDFVVVKPCVNRKKIVLVSLATACAVIAAVCVALMFAQRGSDTEAAPIPARDAHHVHVVLGLELSKAAFNTEKQKQFVRGVAAAAAIDENAVSILAIQAASSRRLLVAQIHVQVLLDLDSAPAAAAVVSLLDEALLTKEVARQNADIGPVSIVQQAVYVNTAPASAPPADTAPSPEPHAPPSGPAPSPAEPSDTDSASAPAPPSDTTTSPAQTSCPPHSSATAISSGSAICECMPGFTGPHGGPCEQCAQGEYKNASGSAPCSVCPVHTTSSPGSESGILCVCSPGYTGPNGGPATILKSTLPSDFMHI